MAITREHLKNLVTSYLISNAQIEYLGKIAKEDMNYFMKAFANIYLNYYYKCIIRYVEFDKTEQEISDKIISVMEMYLKSDVNKYAVTAITRYVTDVFEYLSITMLYEELNIGSIENTYSIIFHYNDIFSELSYGTGNSIIFISKVVANATTSLMAMYLSRYTNKLPDIENIRTYKMIHDNYVDVNDRNRYIENVQMFAYLYLNEYRKEALDFFNAWNLKWDKFFFTNVSFSANYFNYILRCNIDDEYVSNPIFLEKSLYMMREQNKTTEITEEFHEIAHHYIKDERLINRYLMYSKQDEQFYFIKEYEISNNSSIMTIKNIV